MYNESKDLRLARANTPIRLLVKSEGKVWIYVPDEIIEDLVKAKPTCYLAELQKWKNALYNQDFFYQDGNGSLHIACPLLGDDGEIGTIEFVGVADGDYIRLVDVRTGKDVSKADWHFVKLESRRIGKNKI